MKKFIFIVITLIHSHLLYAQEVDHRTTTLSGHIIKQLTPTQYLFKTQDGSLIVDIDIKAGRGRVITPRNKLHLTGIADEHSGIIKVYYLYKD